MSRSVLTFLVLATVPLAACGDKPADACPNETAVDPFETKLLPDLQSSGSGGACDTGAAEQSAGAKVGPTGDRPLRHVFVVDHSGSMFADYKVQPPGTPISYYADVPEFADFVANKLAVNFRDGKDSGAVVAFNEFAYAWDGAKAQKIDNGSGPAFEALKVGTREELRTRLEALPAPYAGATQGFPLPTGGSGDCGRVGSAANCSKMLEGLEAARTMLDSDSGEGIIWMVTDNIYDGSGKGSEGMTTAETDQNKAFYESIKATKEYRVVVAYPLVRAADGAWLKTTSLWAYGIYYDRDVTRATPVEEVRRILGDGAPGVLASQDLTKALTGYSAQGSPSPGRPFRFMPLDQDVVRIRLAADVEQVRKHQEMGEKVKLMAKIEVENLLDHRTIDSVTFRIKNAKWKGYEPNKKATKGTPMNAIVADCQDSFVSEPVTLTNIGRGVTTVEVPLEMPPVEYSIHSFSDMTEIAFNDSVVMGGALQAELTDVKSHLEISADAFKGTYGADSLPAIFENPQVCSYVSQFTAKTRKIENPGTVIALLSLGGIAVVAALVAVGGWLLTSVSRRLYVDGVDLGARSIPRMRSTKIERGTELLGTVSLSFGGQIMVRPARGFSIRKDSDAWVLTRETGQSVRVEFRTSRR